MIQKEFPSDEVLKGKYCQIERTGLEVMRSGNLVGNPLLKQFWRGDRWSIAAGGYLFGSEVGLFLATAAKRIERIEPAIRMMPPEFLHHTFTELVHLQTPDVDIARLPNLRKAAGISTVALLDYYGAVKNHFPQQFEPIRLRLFSMFVTVDTKQELTDKRTGAL